MGIFLKDLNRDGIDELIILPKRQLSNEWA